MLYTQWVPYTGFVQNQTSDQSDKISSICLKSFRDSNRRKTLRFQNQLQICLEASEKNPTSWRDFFAHARDVNVPVKVAISRH